MPPNFLLLDATLPDVARLLIAMVQARERLSRKECEHDNLVPAIHDDA
jgi:hypothetical protein